MPKKHWKIKALHQVQKQAMSNPSSLFPFTDFGSQAEIYLSRVMLFYLFLFPQVGTKQI